MTQGYLNAKFSIFSHGPLAFTADGNAIAAKSTRKSSNNLGINKNKIVNKIISLTKKF